MPPDADAVNAIPTKQFFVSMLTRDIKLEDAILDLVDNSLDGALRIAKGGYVDYAAHFVEIEMTGDHFSILDNCGGIPRETAINYAFRMGRDPDDLRDSQAETIGMYGVGMKRAIFKMGRQSIVQTRFVGDEYVVPITGEWLDAKDWDPLRISEITQGSDRLSEAGTKISVTSIYEGVAKFFGSSGFEDLLRKAIAEHFTVFLQAGLVVRLNGKNVEPVRVEVLVSKLEGQPAPYVFKQDIDGVTVSMAVGFNSGRILSDDEEGETGVGLDRSSATAGWTVFCNNRAVIVGDKSRLTGWGDGIPLYHPQFAVITGIVEFRSVHADRLPVTTTKRALDTTSNIWLQTLVKMREGMRVWTSYTNKWKNHPRADQSSYWVDAQPMTLALAIESVSSRKDAKLVDGRVEFNPLKAGVLKEPPGSRPSSRRIVFTRPVEEIRLVSKALFEEPDEKPGIVGEVCFEMQLNKARNGGVDR